MKESVKEEIRQIVREELSEQQAARSGHEPGSADDMAERAMLASDWKLAEQQGLSPAEALRKRTGIDASEYSNETELRAAVQTARGN